MKVTFSAIMIQLPFLSDCNRPLTAIMDFKGKVSMIISEIPLQNSTVNLSFSISPSLLAKARGTSRVIVLTNTLSCDLSPNETILPKITTVFKINKPPYTIYYFSKSKTPKILLKIFKKK